MPKKSAKKKEKTEEAKPEKKKLSSEEYEKRVLELAKSGLNSEKIGEMLRKEGRHPSEHGKKISKILKEKELYNNPDIKNLEAKLAELDRHHQSNKKDRTALKTRERIQAKLRKLKKYFKTD